MTRICVMCFAFMAMIIGLQGCVSVRTNHGYVLERGETALEATAGFDTKDSVLAKYGEPSLIGTFDRDAWYYLTSSDQARAFFRPKVQRREIVAFHFDGEGVVDRVETIELEDSIELKMASGATPTRGKELSFWEQLLGNVGQLPTSSGAGGPAGPR